LLRRGDGLLDQRGEVTPRVDEVVCGNGGDVPFSQTNGATAVQSSMSLTWAWDSSAATKM